MMAAIRLLTSSPNIILLQSLGDQRESNATGV
jgi:hypothetical protein